MQSFIIALENVPETSGSERRGKTLHWCSRIPRKTHRVMTVITSRFENCFDSSAGLSEL
jgi:hypothetical protein